MQKLKRKPLLPQLGNTIGNLFGSVKPLLARLAPSPRCLTMGASIILLILLLSLAQGCARQIRPSLPPQADPRPIPEFEGKTYRDVLLYVVELRESCQSSEADKAAIRDVFK